MNSPPPSRLSATTRAEIERRLGRRPRGLREVAVADAQGHPMVIRVASVVDGKPFPTLFWLIDPELCRRIDRDEARGVIAQFQARLDRSSALRAALRRDHARHIALRLSYLTAPESEMLKSRGQWAAIGERGIGGIADWSRIRCLHTWYAAHLVHSNTVGRLLDARWASPPGG